MLGSTATISIRTIARMTRRSTGLLGHGVVPASVQRVATEDALDAEPASLQRAVALDRLQGVVRARRREATLEHPMRDGHLVSTYREHHCEPRPATGAHVIRLTTAVNSARRTANEAA